MYSVPQHVSDVYSPFFLRGDENGGNATHFADLQHSAGNAFHNVDAFCLSTNGAGSMDNGIRPSNFSALSATNFHFAGLSNSLCSSEIGSSSGGLETGQLMQHKGGTKGSGGGYGGGAAGFMGNEQFEKWTDSGVAADLSNQTDFSTNNVDKNQHLGVHNQRSIFVDSTAQTRDEKALSKLAQNRETARKCRLGTKVYVQQLESNQQKLIHLEQEIKKTRQQGNSVRFGFCSDERQNFGASCVVFDVEYTQWQNEHQRLIIDLRTALNSHLGDNQLQLIVEAVISHYDQLFRIKRSGVKSDIFHVLSGIWKTPTERFFMWLGGFRCSDVLKVLGNKIEPLTEQQLVGICNLQQSSQQAEDALSQGVEALQQSIVDTLSYDSHAPHNAGNIDDYVGRMAIAISKIATLDNFLHQADLLRLETLQQLQRILSTRQTARALLAINDYKSRLRVLSSVWQARPK